MGYLFNGKNCTLWPQTILELLAVVASFIKRSQQKFNRFQ